MIAIILAGGLGERLRPLTNETPKPLLDMNGKPIILRCIENLREHGIKDIIISVGYKHEMIENYFGDGGKFGVNILYNIEEQPLGTGGAVKDILNKFDIKEDFALVWGDNLADFDFSSLKFFHNEKDGLITMSLTKREDVENFGVVNLDKSNMGVMGFVEKPKREEAPTNLINAGAFIINPKAIEILPEGIKSSIERECFEVLAKEGKIYGHEHEGFWFPTDTLEKYEFAKSNIN